MPHLPDSQHPDHDLELIAAYAAGDATGPELERATAQVAGCDECAALHHDLRSIAAAMPTLPAAVRSRDFTLTPEQAARLRPSGIRGLLATLSGPRFSFATPVGTGLAALGIVGVIVASGGLPASGGAASGERVALEAPAAASAASSAAPQEIYAAGARPADASASPGSDTSGGFAPAPSDPSLKSGTGPAPEPTAVVDESVAAQSVATDGAVPEPWLALAILLVFAGTALVGARLVAGRLARAP